MSNNTLVLCRMNGDTTAIDTDDLMRECGLDPAYRYEDIGLQGDGTIVIFDKCGNFGYVDSDKYFLELTISIL